MLIQPSIFPASPSPSAVLDASCKCMKSDLRSAQAWRAFGGVWREVLESLLFRHEKAARFGGYDIQNYQLTICKG
ncbi:hypothetical protein vBYenM3117_016 [Yersinia phage vB_YenM_31.17]|uniref:hypothetical protein n=1 Tax=Yersinia phage vB_YenM_31.17 TaxID=2914028 RepID=UPI002329052F|nr:hypothetical protein PQA70_gp16 [Yersinia phage vB_YenM_31.17]UKL54242.1 hypothetical protein vBYenM3117_016 [Yersinia phage vB_YenM_31.17]